MKIAYRTESWTEYEQACNDMAMQGEEDGSEWYPTGPRMTSQPLSRRDVYRQRQATLPAWALRPELDDGSERREPPTQVPPGGNAKNAMQLTRVLRQSVNGFRDAMLPSRSLHGDGDGDADHASRTRIPLLLRKLRPSRPVPFFMPRRLVLR